MEKKISYKSEITRTWLGIIIFLFVVLVILIVLHYNSIYVPGPGPNEGPNCIPAPSYSCYKTLMLNETGQLSGAFVNDNRNPEYNISIACISPSNNSYPINNSSVWEKLQNLSTLTNGTVVNFVVQCYRPDGTILNKIAANTSVQGFILIQYMNSTTGTQSNKIVLWFSSSVT